MAKVAVMKTTATIMNMAKIWMLTFTLALVVRSECFAQELSSAQQAVFAAVTSKAMSPYCPGKLLSDCPSGKASELKTVLREKILSGADEQSLMTYLEDQYGKETIQSVPEVSGFSAFAWRIVSL